jgi:hypothetical protein
MNWTPRRASLCSPKLTVALVVGSEYRSLAATLRACDEVAAIAQPQASYWPVYQDALSHRLRRAAGAVNGAAHSKAPIWRHLFNTSLSVPAPLAAIVLLLLLASSILSLFLLVRPVPIVINAPHAARTLRKSS